MVRLKYASGPLVFLPLVLAFAACSDSGEGRSDPGDGAPLATLELVATYPEPFSYLSGVRELPDGSLLAADPLSQVLLKVDMETGTADTLGSVGEGPQEYQQPDQVFPLPADSTLLVDLGKTYLTVVGPDGSFHDGMSMALPTEDGPPTIILPRAVDAQGRIYYQNSGGMGEGPQDSLTVMRYDRETGTSEAVATAWRTPPIITRSGGNNVRMTRPRMTPNDDWAVAPDGSVAIVRANGYFVEWFRPDGEVVAGPETPFQPRTITQADKEANLEENSGAGLAVMITQNSSGGTSMQMSRGGFGMGGGEDPSVEDYEWGETFPPFRTQRSLVSPAGDLWVERWLPVDEQPVMDVFGFDGAFKGSVAIPRDRQLIGFGKTSEGGTVAYFVRTDEVDLQWLERYRVDWE